MFRPILLAAGAALLMAAAPSAHVAPPLQPWRNADHTVFLLRPLRATPETTATSLGALMPSGWRLVWDGIPTAGAGEVVIRLQLPAAPAPPETAATEILQVGRSRDPDIVVRCLRDGIATPNVRRLPDRTLAGTRFLAWHNSLSDANQTIAGTDLRAIVGGICYAVERFRIATTVPGAATSGSHAAPAARLLDASLASLRVGLAARTPPRPPTLRPTPGAVAR